MDDQTSWLLAQGEVDGRPIYLRARDPSQTSISQERSFVVVASLNYPVADALQAPSVDDYEKIEAFEANVFDALGGDPELVFVETGSGVIRYFAYTSDADQTFAAITESAPFEIVDFDSAEDPEWQMYHRRVAKLVGG